MSLTILVISDELAIRELLQEFLADEGFSVESCPYRLCDLERIRHLAPALLILDEIYGWGRPNEAWLQRLKTWRAALTCPILLCTLSRRELDTLLPPAPTLLTIPKPFEMDDLLRLVRALLPNPRSSPQ